MKTIRKWEFRRDLRELGPCLITGAADDDPSGIAAYSQAGAQFGFSMLSISQSWRRRWVCWSVDRRTCMR